MFLCHSREAIVTVRSYKDGLMDGYLQHPRLKGKKRFQSLSQMVLLLDRLFDLEHCPNQPPPLICTISKSEKEMDGFFIQVLFREHYTWQGRLMWQNQNQEFAFRSAFELLQLLDEILAE